MRAYLLRLLGVAGYLLVSGVLLDLDWTAVLRPLPVFLVLMGMVVLTLTQTGLSHGWAAWKDSARWNALISGVITSVFTQLSQATNGGHGAMASPELSESLLPLIYGGLLSLLLGFADRPTQVPQDSVQPGRTPLRMNPMSPEVQEPILIQRGLSPRERHVAMKLLSGATNREVAAQLFISEATVKKHIQNLFRKCEASDRQAFTVMYLEWYEEYQRQSGMGHDPLE